ncbi:MAG: cupin domain-containing protein [Chloroflexia bacterium]|nr:cupin domain-containing protein [Chloroflexia bacterium]MDQ3411390.1 cupin domain-containing protein [Chloroflexota bacterium]
MTDRQSPALTSEQVTLGIEALKAHHGPPPWAATLVRTDQYIVTVICQGPGHRNDWHYHLADECWSVHEGELSWTLEGKPEPIRVKAGEWILAPANTFHLIEVRGDRPAIRVAISHADEYHRHERVDAPPAPPGARQ